jgi:hypothetical protein
MKKIIKLTESDLHRIVRMVLNESDLKKVNNPKVTSDIKRLLGVKDLSKGKFVLKIGGGTGIVFFHPNYDENKKSIKITLKDMMGVPDKGTWSINGTYLTLKK